MKDTKAIQPASPPWIARAQASLGKYPTGRRYLIGVSGGRDSVALLHLLHALGYRRLVVCHLNHQLRGAASAADERFVGRLAAKLGCEFVSQRQEVAALAKETRQSMETAARNARYAFFEKVACQKRCDCLFLAHHADDRVETFLFNLFRGAGPAGMGAIRAEVVRGKLRVIRPLLGTWRAEIDQYIEENRLKFREDATNQELHLTRNRLRHRVIPFLEKEFGRQIRKSLWRTAEILAGEEQWLCAEAERAIKTAKAAKAGKETRSGHEGVAAAEDELSVHSLRQLPEALQRRCIHSWLKAHAVPDAGFEEVEKVRSLLPLPAKVAKINLPGNHHARRRAGKIFLQSGCGCNP